MKRLLRLIIATSLCGGALAQTYPVKPITLVVPFAAGGPTDTVARQLGLALQKPLGEVTIVVENVAGAGGTIAATKVARAKPDGYTLLVWHIGMASTASLYRKLQFDALNDFEYLGLIGEVPMTLLSSTRVPARDYPEFERLVKTRREQFNLAHAGLGSASHLCGLMWQSAIGLEKSLNSIAYRGTAPAMNDLVSGRVDVMCDQTTNTASQIETARVKAYAVTSAQPLSAHSVLKTYPTLQQLGLQGFQLTVWQGVYAPKGTPPAITRRLNSALLQVLKDPEFVQQQEAMGASVVTDGRNTPAGHKAFVAQEIVKLKAVIDAAGQFAD